MTQSGDVDLAVITRTAGCDGEIIRREPMIWISSPGKEALTRTPLPVALYEAGSEARSVTIAALNNNNIRYRAAYSSFSHSALLAIVEAGLAIAAVVEMSAPAKFLRLNQSDALPPIAALDVMLIRSATSDRAPCDAIAEAILLASQ